MHQIKTLVSSPTLFAVFVTLTSVVNSLPIASGSSGGVASSHLVKKQSSGGRNDPRQFLSGLDNYKLGQSFNIDHKELPGFFDKSGGVGGDRNSGSINNDNDGSGDREGRDAFDNGREDPDLEDRVNAFDYTVKHVLAHGYDDEDNEDDDDNFNNDDIVDDDDDVGDIYNDDNAQVVPFRRR
ncbi:hypothetical protein H4219_005785 [Mycoemilia scoparia]|uniref:Uncharacterized protein n=1 Tax=Mycoemilia scoparia TaxID=417184 RepID=A0A9W7ZS61_9FUNG|nr:hypothetical protein H4219_005785 [Mycoemilia scoparia]